MLELKNIQIKFTEPVIEDGRLLIPDGELTALTGPSGSGKTTLLYCVGLVSSCKDYGYIFDGKQIDLSSEEEKGNLRKTKIGYIFQENNLNQNLTAGENVRLSASLAGADTGASRIGELLEQVGLSGQGNSYPASLSGGEQQRLAIACALAKEPELIIADEPTSSLDEENTEQVLKLLERIAAEGKKVVVASHSKAVVERCGVVYDIQERKPVLVKGQEYIEKEDSKEEKGEAVGSKAEKKKRKLKLPFYLRYQRKSGKRGQVLKGLTVGICALSVAFTALSTGYVKDFGEQQKQYFQAVSERELVVVKRDDPNYPGSIYHYGAMGGFPLSLTDGQINSLQQMDHIVDSGPYLVFDSALIYECKEFCEQMLFGKQVPAPHISYENRKGKTGTLEFGRPSGETVGGGWKIVDGIALGVYIVRSYFAYEKMDIKCRWIDQSVPAGEGIYFPSQMFELLGLEKDDLEGLVLTVDVYLPVKRGVTVVHAENSEGEKYDYDGASDWYVRDQLSLPVRGVLEEDANAFMEGCALYAPYDVMMEHTQANLLEEDDFPDIYYEYTPWARSWFKGTYDWRPWAYYLMVDDVANIDAVKKAVAEIAPDLDVIHEYQDYQAVMESVDNSQKMVLYVSLAILAVILCLSAIVYVNIIDKRKYEIAMLRANGLTKGEIRKLVMSEMGVQAVITFLVSLLLAWAGYEILSRTVGGFAFNWLTVMWLGVISVISVVLPSGVALVLSNRYEPDRVLRN